MLMRYFLYFYFLLNGCFASDIFDAFLKEPSTECLNVVTGEWCESHEDMGIEGPFGIELKRAFFSEERNGEAKAHGWHFNLPEIFCRDHHRKKIPEFTNRRLNCSYDEQGRLQKIETLKQKDGKIINWISFDYSAENRCIATSSDQQKIGYLFEDEQLKSIESNQRHLCSYEYVKHPTERKWLISQKTFDDSRKMRIEYYDQPQMGCQDPIRDIQIGKVRSLLAPIGNDHALLCSTLLEYYPGFTVVKDAHLRKTIYRFDTLSQITKIEHYNLEGNLYRFQQNFWQNGQIRSKTLCDGNGLIYLAQFYNYDTEGHIIREMLVGNLSGEMQVPIVIENGELVQNGVETYSKTYEYSGNQLFCEKEDNGKTVKYFYDSKSQLLIKRFLLDGENLKSRTFYRYDEDSCLIEEISDDGNDYSEEVLSGVTFRKIEKSLSLNDQGLPLIKEYKHLNLKTLQEELDQTEINDYSVEGKLLTQTVTDAYGVTIASKKFAYNKEGLVSTIEEDPGHFKSFRYDNYGNLTFQFDSESEEELLNTYDFANRLIRKERKKLGKLLESSSKVYDLKGNCIRSSDSHGNETEFTFDEFNRQTSLRLPRVLDENNQEINPKTIYVYDIVDRVIEEIDPKGYSTKTEYNARSLPIKIYFPDGSQESFEYFLDGTLKKEIKRDKTQILYTRDFLGNPIKKTHLSATSQILEEEIKEFNAFHLLREVSSQGREKRYTYDSLGRIVEISEEEMKTVLGYTSNGLEIKSFWNDELISKTCKDDEGTFVYDSNGKLRLRKEEKKEKSVNWQEEVVINSLGQLVIQKKSVDKNGILSSILLDALNRPVRMEKYDLTGQKILEQELFYDAVGNKANFKFGKLQTLWNYGPMNRLEEVMEMGDRELRRITKYSYNQLGQLASVIKPDAVSINYIYDDFGKNSEFFSSDGTVYYHFTYDCQGNLIQCEDLIQNQKLIRNYDSKGQLIEENFGDFSLKNRFDEFGRRKELILPDRSSIEYFYDHFFLRKIVRTENGCEKYNQSFTEYDVEGKLTDCCLIGNLGPAHYEYQNERLKIIQTPFHKMQKFKKENGEKIVYNYTLGSFENQISYDDSERIISEHGPFEKDYHYDFSNNLKNASQEYGDLNELLFDSDSVYTYDLNGNLTSYLKDGDFYELFYDALNRLTKISCNQNPLASFTYDCFHRRLTKTTHKTHLRFFYDGLLEIGALDPEGKMAELRVLGLSPEAEIGAAVAVELQQKIYAPLHDLQGSVIGLVSLESRQLEQSTQFSAFGEKKILFDSTPGNPWGYHSKREDPETGLLFFGRRFYFPKLCRWITPDPSGYVDGTNLYVFAQNNPLQNKDLFGLSSFSNSIKNFFLSVFKKIKGAFTYLYKKVKKIFSLETYDRLFAKGFLFCLGYYVQERDAGIYGKGEVSDRVRVTLINGMLTNEYWLSITLQALSYSHGGVNIHYVHRPPTNFFLDGLRAFMVRLGLISPHARLLADTWKELINEMGGIKGGGEIIHYAHSIGTSETLSALHLLNEDERKMIKVYSFGSPTLSTKYPQVHHFVSIRDGVCLMDLSGFLKAATGKNSSVTFVGNFLGIPFIDHLFGTKSYKDIWEAMGKTFVEWYGSLL